MYDSDFSDDPNSGFFISESVIHANSAHDGGGAFVSLGENGFHNVAKDAVFDVQESVVSGNTAQNRGGGIYLYGAGGSLSKIQNSSISGNDAGVDLNGFGGHIPLSGGGLYAYLMSGPFEKENSTEPATTLVSSLTISGSTIDTNTAGNHGGGVLICAKRGGLSSSKFGMVNSTVSGNSAGATTDPVQELGEGGGIHLAVPDFGDSNGEGLDSEFHNVTITNNTAGTGAGIFSEVPGDSESKVDTSLKNTIVSGNRQHDIAPGMPGAANNFWGSINAVETQYNLISDDLTAVDNRFVDHITNDDITPTHDANFFTNIGTGNWHNGGTNNPRLAPLELNGGLTRTHRPLTFGTVSPVIDAGDPSKMFDLNEFDQRGAGFPRVVDSDFDGTATVDIGAYEVGFKYWMVVTTENDELDPVYDADDLSLREAVAIVNTTSYPTKVILPTGKYDLDRTGVETGNATYNDLDITGDLTLVGAGAGLSVIDASGLTSSHGRDFDVTSGGAELGLSQVTVANASASTSNGLAVRVQANSSVTITDSAIVNHFVSAPAIPIDGAAVYSSGGDVTILRSTFTGNKTTIGSGAAIAVLGGGGNTPTVTIGQSIFALNEDSNSNPNVYIGVASTLVDLGDNLYDDISGGFFDAAILHPNNHLGTPDYVVTTVEDTYFDNDNDYSLSLREAINQSNLKNGLSGEQEIWLPAWDFKLTRDRATYGGGSVTDSDIAFGDLDISESLTIRGVRSDLTNVSWLDPQASDEVFDLLGDYNDAANYGFDINIVSFFDYLVWLEQNGMSGSPNEFLADGNDDGVVNQADFDLLVANLNNVLHLENLSVS